MGMEVKQVSVSDLINQCKVAASQMSRKNSHRLLIMNCAYSLRQLVDRLSKLEVEKTASE